MVPPNAITLCCDYIFPYRSLDYGALANTKAWSYFPDVEAKDASAEFEALVETCNRILANERSALEKDRL